MNSKHGSAAAASSLFCAFLIFAVELISVHAAGLAFDAAGNLFKPDGHLIFEFTPDGTKSVFAAGFKNALRLSFDSSGDLFVSDTGSHSICELTPGGKKSTFATDIDAVGMAFDDSGNLFVSNGDSIFKFTPEGVKSTFVSGLGNPIDLAFDGAGNLFVADTAVIDARFGRTILKFSSNSEKSIFASGLSDPTDLALDRAGNLFISDTAVADARSRSILKFSSDGTKSTFASGLSPLRPSGLAFDRAGNLFVSNRYSILKFDSSGARSTFASDRVSPDKQWEYQCSDSGWAGIAKAGTTQTVLDLSEDAPQPNEAEAVWAPDSKRFAFNYSPPHAPHTSYETTALYQLRDNKWVLLRSPVDEASESAQLTQLARKFLPKNTYQRRIWDSSPVRDILKVRKWSDADTAVLYAYAAWYRRGSSQLEATVLFTLKVDAEGNWKIVKAQELSSKELQKENAEER
jgi:sugar lactone lactonase YvrE